MQKIETSLPGVWELRPNVFQDGRGYFIETYHQTKFAALGIADDFVQDNYSCSKKGTLRGLHYQLRHPQAKLCRVDAGEALDVAVDLRVGSPNFGKWTSVLLSSKKNNLIYIPAGFAHGFVALAEGTQFLYKCSNFYDASDEGGILWNDAALGIQWGVAEPLVSEKDQKNPVLAAVPLERLPRHHQT